MAAGLEPRLAGRPQTPPAKPGSRRALLTGIAIGVAVSGIPLILIALTGGQVAQVAVAKPMLQAAGLAVAKPMPPAAGGNVTPGVTHSTVINPVWPLLLRVLGVLLPRVVGPP